jgi:hypothetical protein
VNLARNRGGPICIEALTGGDPRPRDLWPHGRLTAKTTDLRPDRRVPQLTDMVATEHATTTQPARWDE